MGLLPPGSRLESGEILFAGRSLPDLDREAFRRLRGREIGMVFQEPDRSLNPSMRIGTQIAETIITHLGVSKAEAKARAVRLLGEVGLRDPGVAASSYAHELSGGMRQRAAVALAVACSPSLLIADEVTTALDPSMRSRVLASLSRLKGTMGMVFVSHDLKTTEKFADTVAVVYSGRVAETLPASRIRECVHPYTALLLEAIPSPGRRGRRLASIPGRAPDRDVGGCPFHPRWPHAVDLCRESVPAPSAYGDRHTASCHVAKSLGRRP